MMYTIFDQATQQAMSIKRSSGLDLEAEENGEASQKSTTKRAKVYYPATMSGEIIDKPPSGTPADEDCLTTVVDSQGKGKATMPKVTCLVCAVEMRSNDCRRHIFEKHLMVVDLFSCTDCSFQHESSVQAVRNHAKRTHGNANATRNRLSEFKDQIMKFEEGCFGKPTKRRKSSADWITCGVCDESMKAFERREHVLRVHVNIADMFHCLSGGCDFKSSYSRESVVQHAKKLHGVTAIGSREEELKTAIMKRSKTCFPGKVVVFSSFIGVRRNENLAGVSSHPGGQRGRCRLCRKDLHESDATHVRRKHLPPMYFSPVCEYYAFEPGYVSKHLLAHHEDTDPQGVGNKSADYKEEFVKAFQMCFDHNPSDDQFEQPEAVDRCNLCFGVVSEADAASHIYREHMAVEDLFECGVCHLKSSWDRQGIFAHVIAVHGDLSLFESRAELPLQQAKFIAFVTACFEKNLESKMRQCSKSFDVTAFCSVATMACRLCDDGKPVVRNRMKEHVWKKHMGQMPFCCPHCAETRFRESHIREHIDRFHADEDVKAPVDRSEQLREESVATFKQCFGNC